MAQSKARRAVLKAADLTAIAKMVDVALMRKLLEDLTGVNEVTIDGAKHRFLTRSTFTPGALLTVRYLEDFYSALGVSHTRHNFTLSKEKSPDHVLWKNMDVEEVKCANLLAEIVGDFNAEKILFIGSHFDSRAGRRFTAEKDARGADDNGTGTVAAMIIASILVALKKAGYKLGCTVRFGHFTGEEQSLLGSRRYVKSLPDPKPDLRMIMLEMMGWTSDGTNRVDFIDCGEPEGHKLAAVFMKAVKTHKLKLKTVNFNHRVPQRPSDYVPFDEADFPAICISEDSSDEGLNPHMHSTGDTIDKIDFDFWSEVVRMLVIGVVTTANVTRA